MNRLLTKYRQDIVPILKKELGLSTVMEVPKIDKVTVNVGAGRVSKDSKMMERISSDLAKITGQKPSVRAAKKSISGFKLREGMPIGFAVTLRGTRMYDFIDRLISIALPRSRDFQGLNQNSFDRDGNLSIGIKEQNIFPEVSYETMKDIFGLQVTVVTNAGSKEKGIKLLKMMGFPIKN